MPIKRMTDKAYEKKGYTRKFVTRLVELRKKNRFSIAGLGKHLNNYGITDGMVKAWTRTSSVPNAKNLATLAQLFSVSEAYMRGVSDDATPPVRTITVDDILTKAKNEIHTATGIPLNAIKLQLVVDVKT